MRYSVRFEPMTVEADSPQDAVTKAAAALVREVWDGSAHPFVYGVLEPDKRPDFPGRIPPANVNA